MSSINNLLSPESNVPETKETKMVQYKKHIKNTSGAIIVGATILVGSVFDNNTAQGTEPIIVGPIVATKYPDTEIKISNIIYENPGIYEFLEGDIIETDTLLDLQEKLRRKINGIASNNKYSEFLYDIHSEMFFLKQTNKPYSEYLIQASKQMRNEENAIQNLRKFFDKLSVSTIGDMNGAIISYYNEVDGNFWTEGDLQTWQSFMEKDREKRGYTYQDVIKWINEYEKNTKK